MVVHTGNGGKDEFVKKKFEKLILNRYLECRKPVRGLDRSDEKKGGSV
jgi:hypothetical protein